jgi:hypothetical protein
VSTAALNALSVLLLAAGIIVTVGLGAQVGHRVHRPAHARTRVSVTVRNLGGEVRVLLPATREALTAAVDELARGNVARRWAAAGRVQDLIDAGLLQPIGPRPDYPGYPDPGNPGYHLRLARDPHGAVSSSGLVLLAWNPPTGEGAPTLVALGVPADCRDPLTAAAWTYDVPPAVYTQIARRT